MLESEKQSLSRRMLPRSFGTKPLPPLTAVYMSQFDSISHTLLDWDISDGYIIRHPISVRRAVRGGEDVLMSPPQRVLIFFQWTGPVISQPLLADWRGRG